MPARIMTDKRTAHKRIIDKSAGNNDAWGSNCSERAYYRLTADKCVPEALIYTPFSTTIRITATTSSTFPPPFTCTGGEGVYRVLSPLFVPWYPERALFKTCIEFYRGWHTTTLPFSSISSFPHMTDSMHSPALPLRNYYSNPCKLLLSLSLLL